MRKSLIFLATMTIFNLAASELSESGYLYQLNNQDGRGTSIYYNHRSDQYEFKTGDSKALYYRRDFQRLLKRELILLPDQDQEQVIVTMTSHAKTREIELKQRANEGKVALSKEQINKLSTSAKKRIEKASMARRGFVSLSDLTGFRINLENSNDNALNGIFWDTGITNCDSEIEGDDRGETFGVKLEAAIDYKNMTITIRRHDKVYGRLIQRDGDEYNHRSIKCKGDGHVQEITKNIDDNRTLQESLNIANTELEIVYGFDNEVYAKVIARYKEMDDQAGLALNLQDKYHGMIKDAGANIILYDYVDHLEKRSGAELYIEGGRIFSYDVIENIRIEAIPYFGYNVSTLGSDQRMVEIGGELKAVFFSTTPSSEKFGRWQVRVYGSKRFYEDDMQGDSIGGDISASFRIGRKSFVTILIGVEQNDDRFQREYGHAEYERNGKFDLNHFFSVQFEKRTNFLMD